MASAWKAILCVGTMAAATPALAAPGRGYAPSYGTTGDVLRVEVGGAGLGSDGYFCDRFGGCGYSPWGYSAFVLGADYDMPLGRSVSGLNLTLGARLLTGGIRYGYGSLTFLEPSLGLTWKFRGLRAPLEPRLHAGVGVYAGSDFGAAVRLGAGIGFVVTPRVSLGADLMLEVGGLAGYGFTAAQFTIGPEFRM